jgi:hypothetical protein
MPNQTGRKRTQREREADRVEIIRMWTHGISIMDIARNISGNRAYSLSYVTIYKDVQVCLKQWRESILADVGELRAGELARINQIEQEAWAAWEKSKQIAEKKITGRKTGSHEGTVAQLIQEAQCGDPRYLQQVQWCIEKRCKLLGLDAPQKIAPTDPSGQTSWLPSITDDELLSLARAQGIPLGDNSE